MEDNWYSRRGLGPKKGESSGLVETKMEDGRVGTEYKTWGVFGGPMAYAFGRAGLVPRVALLRGLGEWLESIVEGLEDK